MTLIVGLWYVFSLDTWPRDSINNCDCLLCAMFCYYLDIASQYIYMRGWKALVVTVFQGMHYYLKDKSKNFTLLPMFADTSQFPCFLTSSSRRDLNKLKMHLLDFRLTSVSWFSVLGASILSLIIQKSEKFY